jgi:hypothetical protein
MESGSRPGGAEEVDGWWYGFEWGTVGVISVVGCAKVVVVVVIDNDALRWCGGGGCLSWWCGG